MSPVEGVGERVGRLHEERGLTQRQLAEPGVSFTYLSRIEVGARQPSLPVLRKFADRLGVTALYIETGRDDGVCPHCGRSAR